jgi:hypothetical protein
MRFLSGVRAPRYTLSSGKLTSKVPHVSVALTLKGGRLPLSHVPTPVALMWTCLTHPPRVSAMLMEHESAESSGTCPRVEYFSRSKGQGRNPTSPIESNRAMRGDDKVCPLTSKRRGGLDGWAPRRCWCQARST